MTEDAAKAGRDPGASSDAFAQWQEELGRNLLRMHNVATMILNPADPEVGVTPREES